MKYTASSPGTASATASATHTTAAEVVANQITAAVALPTDIGEGRTKLIITRGNYSNSPTYLQNYQYAIGPSINPTNWEYFPNYGFDATVTVAGLSNDTLYYVRTRAISTHSTLSGGVISLNATATTNPALPPTPTIAFRSMSHLSYGTAQFTITGNGGSTTAVYVARRGISNNNHLAEFIPLGTGSQDITTGHPSDGGTKYYVAYNYNRLGEASAPSNEIYWTRPKKDVEKVWKGNDTGQAWYFDDYTYVIPTNACQPVRLSYTFGPSGIPADSNSPGYARVDFMRATFRCGVQLKRPSDNANFQVPGAGNTGALTSLCNTNNLRFSYATVGDEGTQNADLPTGAFGVAVPYFGSSDQIMYRAVSVGGTSLNNKTFMATMATGKGWNSGCVLSLKGDYYSGKLFELVGVVTTAGSGTGF